LVAVLQRVLKIRIPVGQKEYVGLDEVFRSITTPDSAAGAV